MKTLLLLYQLTAATLGGLSQAQIAIMDPDFGDADQPITAQKVERLQASGTKVIFYISIGEAEEFRDYWKESGYDPKTTPFILDLNEDWGSHRVAFWRKEWRDLTLARVKELAERGADGMYLDIVDGYMYPAVKEALKEDQMRGKVSPLLTPRKAMEQFVADISATAKAVNPNIDIIPQNGMGLLVDESGAPNESYLAVIDGVGAEDTWTRGDEAITWTDGNLALMRVARDAGKDVYATDYPTKPKLQQRFVENALKEGFIPFVGDRALNDNVPAVNKRIPKLAGGVAQ